MKSILILLEDHPSDVISYNDTKRNINKELQLVIKFVEKQVCDIKKVEMINSHKLVITSKKDTIFNISWRHTTVWDESELKD